MAKLMGSPSGRSSGMPEGWVAAVLREKCNFLLPNRAHLSRAVGASAS